MVQVSAYNRKAVIAIDDNRFREGVIGNSEGGFEGSYFRTKADHTTNIPKAITVIRWVISFILLTSLCIQFIELT